MVQHGDLRNDAIHPLEHLQEQFLGGVAFEPRLGPDRRF